MVQGGSALHSPAMSRVQNKGEKILRHEQKQDGSGNRLLPPHPPQKHKAEGVSGGRVSFSDMHDLKSPDSWVLYLLL